MIHFNEIKHHHLAIKQFIQKVGHRRPLDWSEITEKLKLIGSRTLDLYIGNLTQVEIRNQLIVNLKKTGIESEKAFVNHINNQPNHYFLLTLSDNSKWVLRIGRPPLNVVHIHPGRYSPHTVRTHGNALKTAIIILCSEVDFPTENFSIDQVNELRNKTGLSPVSKLEALIKIKKLLKLLSSSDKDRII